MLGGLAFGLWPTLFGSDAGLPSQTVLLDQVAPLRSDGTEFAFTVRQPAQLKIWVSVPDGQRATVRFGVAGAAKRRDIAYAPLRERELTFRAEGQMRAPFERDVMAVGIYILRIDPIPQAMGSSRQTIHARVTAAPLIER